MANLTWIRIFFLEKVAVYFWSTALYVLNMKKMITAEIKKIKNLKNSFAPNSQANGQRDRERKKFGKILF